MPSKNELKNEIQTVGDTYSLVRKKYIKKLSDFTGRNTITYYSGFLQAAIDSVSFGINDNDINDFMSVVHNLDVTKGLDLILHTPGGEIGPTESIINYLREIFSDNINVIIPQIAMSGGTVIACNSKNIYMGKQSSLGPTDPQYRGVSAIGVVNEFKEAKEEVKKFPNTGLVWNSIIGKYNPAMIHDCELAIDWSKDIAQTGLKEIMFKDDHERIPKSDKIISYLTNTEKTKSHSRHISSKMAKDMGLKIIMLEDEQTLQDLVLSIHHISMLTFDTLLVYKIVENNIGQSELKIHIPNTPKY